MRKFWALAWVIWVFAAAPALCLGGYIPRPWSRADSCPDSRCPDPSSPDSSRPDSSCPDNGLPQCDPCKAQVTKDRVTEQENACSHQAPSFVYLAVLDDYSPAESQWLPETTALALKWASEPFASRSLPLLI